MVLGWAFSLIRMYCMPAVLGLVWWVFLLAFVVYFVTYSKYGKLSRTDSSYLDAFKEIKNISNNMFAVIGIYLVLTVLLFPYDFFTYAIKLGFMTMLGGIPYLYVKLRNE